MMKGPAETRSMVAPSFPNISFTGAANREEPIKGKSEIPFRINIAHELFRSWALTFMMGAEPRSLIAQNSISRCHHLKKRYGSSHSSGCSRYTPVSHRFSVLATPRGELNRSTIVDALGMPRLASKRVRTNDAL